MEKVCPVCSTTFRVAPSRMRVKTCSMPCGRTLAWRNPDYRQHMSTVHKGQPSGNKGKRCKTDRCKQCGRLINAVKQHSCPDAPWNKDLKGYGGGEKHWNWQGGITSETMQLRASSEYRRWRREVLRRDNYQCQMCLEFPVGRKLTANHIKKFSTHPSLRFEPSNGIALCQDCHYGKVNRHEEEYEQLFNSILEAKL